MRATSPRRTALLVSALAVVAVTAGCSADLTVPGSGATTSEQLAGNTYLSTSSTGQTLVAGTRVVMSFEADRLAIDAGCNTMFGGYTIEDGHLKVDALAGTLMACETSLQDQDTWVSKLVTSSPTITDAPSGFTLTSADASLTFADRTDIAASHPFDGTMWLIDSLVVDGTSLTPQNDATVSVYDGSIHVATGCNTGVGGATVDPDAGTVTIDPLATTRMACEDNVMSWEDSLLGFLQGTLTFTMTADGGLDLSSDSGTLHLVPTK